MAIKSSAHAEKTVQAFPDRIKMIRLYPSLSPKLHLVTMPHKSKIWPDLEDLYK